MATWSFYCVDSGGKHQYLTIKAKDKTEAIKKGFEKARKKAKGDIGWDWKCSLISA